MRIMSDMNIAKKNDSGQGKRPLLLLSLFLVSAWLAGMLPGAQQVLPVTAQSGPTITLESASTTINGCETIDVFIRINDVAVEDNLYGADVLLTFDPAVLEVVTLQESEDFLQPPFFITRKLYDNTAGTVRLALTQLNPTLPASGSGNFARVTFRARGEWTNAPLDFSYAVLASINGMTIPSTAVAGSLTTVPPAGVTPSITKLDSTTARLSWTVVNGVESYNIYRDTYAYFTPGVPYQTVNTLTYDDVGALGDVATNYYYVIRSACDNGFESDSANHIGAFDYPLVTGISPQRFNTIGMPLDSASLISPFKASGLAAYVGPGVTQVMKWNSSIQNFDTYLPALPFDPDFDLIVGGAYTLVVDDTPSNLLSIVGEVPLEGTINFNLLPGTISNCSFNSFSIPLNRTDITRASELAADIGGVVQVLSWNPDIQNYSPFLPGLDIPGSFLDFAIRPGYPYLVCLSNTAPTNWP